MDLFDPEDRPRVRDKIERAIATGSASLEADLRTADGRSVPYEFRTQRLTDGEGTVIGLAGVGRDISDRRRRERQLKQQLDQFEHFGSVLSHDLRTPLSTARARLELAQETGDLANVDEAVSALDRLDTLVDNLAEVMREGDLVTDVTTVDLAASLRSVWDALDTVEATLDVGTDVRIRADEAALKRLAENLFVNAIDHAGEDVTVTVGALSDGFYVADDGPGLPEDETERVFEAGYSGDPDGTGFGLASVRQIAMAHGWQIAALESERGGARFEITDVERVE